MEFTLRAPAKINLYLKVLHRRDDGFHSILSLMQMVDLYDTLTFREEGSSVCLEARGNVPQDGSNLVLKAARMLQKQMTFSHRPRKGVVITLDKRIPVSAGLGGGSSDAAATLWGLNKLWLLGLSRRRLAEIGGFVGSDIPFFFYGPTAWVSGRGEQVKKTSLCLEGFLVLVYSGEPVSTAWVYQEIGNVIPFNDVSSQARSSPSLETVLMHPENDLEKVTLKSHPGVQAIKSLLADLGGQSPLMSGSGPTVFARFETREQAEAAAGALKTRGYPDVWVSTFLRRLPKGWSLSRRFFSDSI